MNYDVVTLVTQSFSKNEYGIETVTETETNVFAKIVDISQKEFFNAGNANIKAAYKFILNVDEYNGAKIIKYGTTAYSVYRTYRSLENTIEVYVEEKEGVSGKS